MIALFFDTETTGVKTWEDPDFEPKLIQLGAILKDMDSGRILTEINMLVQLPADTPMQPDAFKAHGISIEQANKFGFDIRLVDMAFGKMVKMTNLLVAHNLDYDLDTVKYNLPQSHSVINQPSHFCTMDNNLYVVKAPLSDKQKVYFSSKGRKPDAPYKVPSLMETHLHYFSKPFEGAHDAMADIRATLNILEATITAGWWEAKQKAGTWAMYPTQKMRRRIAQEQAKA